MMTRAGAVTRPRSSLAGFHVAIRRAPPIGPVRILGPARSMSTRHGLTGLDSRGAQGADRSGPLPFAFVSAVDPEHVHPRPEHLHHPSAVGLFCRRRRDHDVDVSAWGPSTEYCVRMLVQELVRRFPGKGTAGRSLETRQLRPGSSVTSQRQRFVRARGYFAQAAHHATLGATQRRKASLRELALQVSQVVLSQRDVVHEILRALTSIRGDARQGWPHLLLELLDVSFQSDELARQRPQGPAPRDRALPARIRAARAPLPPPRGHDRELLGAPLFFDHCDLLVRPGPDDGS